MDIELAKDRSLEPAVTDDKNEKDLETTSPKESSPVVKDDKKKPSVDKPQCPYGTACYRYKV